MTLASAVQKARDYSVPMDNIERAIKRAAGETGGAQYQEVTYEGYGPGGVAILVHTLTDNPTRTVADLRHKFSRGGGNLGATNSVAWMFERKGQIFLDTSKVDEDTALEAALDAGAEDFKREGDQFIVATDPTTLHQVKGALESKRIVVQESEIAHIPKNTVRVEGKTAEQLLKLLEELEDHDDVQKVAANFDMDVSEMAGA
jgi:YebC/PmpR family DNA-binding regulatory protein